MQTVNNQGCRSAGLFSLRGTWKGYFVFLSRNKAYTAINVFGLSLSLMFVILIGVYTYQEFSVNKQYPKANRIYAYGLIDSGERVLGGNWHLREHFASRYPEIESSCAIASGKRNFLMQGGEHVQYLTTFTDSTLFDMFDIPFVCGDRRQALATRQQAVVSDELARKLYGSPQQAMGKQLSLDEKTHFRITGVVKKVENSSLDPTEVYLRFENVEMFNPSLTPKGMNNATGVQVLFLAKPGTNLLTKVRDMDAYQKEFFWIFQLKDRKLNTFLLPFSELYFSDISVSSGALRNGNLKLVRMLAAAGLVILLFAIFNYINLTTAQSNRRAREMATRRLVGSQRSGIVARLIVESLILCLFSMLVAVLLALVVAPYAAKLLDTELHMELLLRPASMLLIVFFILVVGLLSGVVPATLISRARPIDVVRGTFTKVSRQKFSKLFITIQNAITIVLISVAFIMSAQIRHMVTAPRGFNTAGLLEVSGSTKDSVKMQHWYSELERLPQVTAVAPCCGTPYDGGNNNTFNVRGKTISRQDLVGDEQYMKLFGLKTTGPADVTLPGKLYANRQLLAEEGLPINSKFVYDYEGKRLPIDGILADFHIRGLDSEQHPLLLWVKSRKDFRPWSTVIGIQGDLVEGYEAVRKVYKQVFNTTLDEEHPYIDQQIEAEYEAETRIATIVRLFAFIAIVISLLGLVAMSTYFIQQRRREIALRKVFGSTGRQIRARLIRSFLVYVGVAFVVAVPVVWYFMSQWISQYSYRITWWPFVPLAGAIVLLISFCAVAVQSYMAANENPVKNIKQE